MLPVTQMRSSTGTVKYFDDHLASSDYYSHNGQFLGRWGGRAASLLNLSGSVQRDDFVNLCENINPVTQHQLTARNIDNRTVCYDFTFSVPKSISILYTQTKDNDILEAMNAAIEETMAEVEKDAETRVRIQGKNENRKTGNLAWAAFTHEEARPVGGIPDPHLHQHVIVFNATYDEVEDKWKAGQFRNLKASAHYYDAVYLSKLAIKLESAGYSIERNSRDFELKGFERSTIEKFSNRTIGINKRAEELGLTYAEDKAKLGAKTREKKDSAKPREAIEKAWAEKLTAEEQRLILEAKQSRFASEKKNGVTPSAALEYALGHCLERKSVVEHRELMIHALKRGFGQVSKEELETEIAQHKNLISRKVSNDTLYTTQESLVEERKLIAETRLGRAKKQPLLPGYQGLPLQLSKEQKNAVSHVLESRDFITLVIGRAGTGKTWTMKEIAKAVTDNGKGFHSFAPSAAASRGVQRDDGFGEADTIASLLLSKEKQIAVKDGVIWLDEAGLIGNKTMNRIIHIAKEQNARILLTGDPRQHSSVERGDALQIIQEYGGVQPAYLTKIQRQKSENYKEAINAIADGDIARGYASLDKMGAIKQRDKLEEVLDVLAQDYIAAVKAKESVLVIAPTHSQGQVATAAIRSSLKEQSLLEKEDRVFETQTNLSFTAEQKKDVINYQTGQIVQFDQNAKGFKRGSKYAVWGRDEDGKIVLIDKGNDEKKILPLEEAEKFSVYNSGNIELAAGDKVRITKNGFSRERKRLDNGMILDVIGFNEQGHIIASTGTNELVLDKDYRNFTYGYTTTSPASQGKTVNRVLLLQTTFTGKAASQEQFYVSASRGRFEVSIYTDDKEFLLRSIQQSSKRMTASELVGEKDAKIILNDHFKNTANKSKDWDEAGMENEEIPLATPPPYQIDEFRNDQPEFNYE